MLWIILLEFFIFFIWDCYYVETVMLWIKSTDLEKKKKKKKKPHKSNVSPESGNTDDFDSL